MARKPETRFYSGVNKLLPETIYCEKMANEYRGGTPDVWYSGERTDLWVEYKWLNRLPVRADINPIKLLSALQLLWLRARYKEGRNVVVILGSPEGSWIFEHLTWEQSLPVNSVREQKLSKKDIANYIRSIVCNDVFKNTKSNIQKCVPNIRNTGSSNKRSSTIEPETSPFKKKLQTD